jgi:acyl-CoA thioester hydrolase
MTPNPTLHSWTSQVRDYEIDGYGGVNAAVYLNYMEEARKHYLAAMHIDLAILAQQNISFVVGRYEIDYLVSLLSGDVFEIKTAMKRISRIKFQFTQTILRAHDASIAVVAHSIGIPINLSTGKAQWFGVLNELLGHLKIEP